MVSGKTEMIGIDKDSKLTTQELRNVPEQVQTFVTGLIEEVENAKLIWQEDFDQMKSNMHIVKWGRDERTPKNWYVANICQRHVQSKTAALYARNPQIEATATILMRRREVLFNYLFKFGEIFAAAFFNVVKFLSSMLMLLELQLMLHIDLMFDCGLALF